MISISFSILGRSRKDPIPHMGEIEITPPLFQTSYRLSTSPSLDIQVLNYPLPLNSFILGLDLKTFGLLNLSIAFTKCSPLDKLAWAYLPFSLDILRHFSSFPT